MAGRLGLDPRLQPPEDDDDFDHFFQRTLERNKNEYVSPAERKDYFDKIGLGQIDGDADLKFELYEAPRSRLESVLQERLKNNNTNLVQPKPGLFSSPIIDLDLAKKGWDSTKNSVKSFFGMGQDPQDDPMALTPLGAPPAPQAIDLPSSAALPTPKAPELATRPGMPEPSPPKPAVKTKMLGTPPEEKHRQSFMDKAFSYLPFGGHLQSGEQQAERASQADLISAPREPEEIGSFQKGVGRGVGSTMATIIGGSAAVADVMGADELAENWMGAYEELSRDAEKLKGVPFEEALDSPASFIGWAAGAIGEQVPVMASIAASGGIGGVLGHLTAKGLMREGLKEAAEKAAQTWATRGAVGASATAMGLQEAGGIYGEQQEAGVDRNPYLALAGGAVNGALETLVPFGLAKGMGLGGRFTNKVMEELGKKGVMPRMMAWASGAAAGEALTEELQEEVAIAARTAVDSSYEWAGDEANARRLQAAATGALVGGGMGGVTGALSRTKQEGTPSLDPMESGLPPEPMASEGVPSPLAPEDLPVPDVAQLPSAVETLQNLPPVDLPQTENSLGAFEGQQMTPFVQGPPQAKALEEEGPITEDQILSALGASFPQEAKPKLIKQPKVEEVADEIAVPQPEAVEVKPLGKRAQAKAEQEQKANLASLYDTFRYADAMDDQETMQQVADQLAAQGKELPDPEQFQQWTDIRDTLNAAKNSLGVAGKERGFQARVDVPGQGGTPEIASSKSPTDEWYQLLRSKPSGGNAEAKMKAAWSNERINRVINEGLLLLPGETPTAEQQVLLDTIQQDPKYSQLLVAEPEAAYDPNQTKLFDEAQPDGQPAAVKPEEPKNVETKEEPNKPTPYSFQPEPQDDFALTPLAETPRKAKAAEQPELFGLGETLQTGVSHIIGREVTPDEAPLFSKTAQEEDPEQLTLMEKEAKYQPKRETKFYSQLQRTLEAKMPNAAPASQVVGILKSGNVKQDELEWSGLQEYLADKPKVTKQEVMDYLQGNQVQIKDVSKTGPTKYKPDEVEYIGKEERGGAEFYMFKVPDNVLQIPTSKYTSVKAAREHVLTKEKSGTTKFSQYTLPGGENYQEHLLTLPQLGTRNIGGVLATEGPFAGAEAAPNEVGVFQSSHFDEPNILAHVRTNDRTGPNGEKILFVEEVQSDWHQKGKKEGYAVSSQERERFEREQEAIDKTIRKLSKWPNDNYVAKKKEDQAELDTLNAKWDELEGKIFHAVNGVSNAPFKKTWHELAMKKMLRKAVDEGYDQLSWITGDDTAKRYDLSKHLDSIVVEPYDDLGLNITGYKEGKEVLAERDIEDKKLADYIGKDAAEKALLQLEEKDRVVLSDLDLKVGGEWAKSLYDKMIPQFMQKFTKKWGGKVEEGSIKGDNAPEHVVAQYADQPDHPFTKKQKIPVHTLKITDAMRESVQQEGLPIFEKEQPYESGIPTTEGRDGGVQRGTGGAKESLGAGAAAGRQGTGSRLSTLREGGGVKTHAKRLTAELKKNQRVDLRGAKAETPDDIADLAQIFRSPQYETLRVWYVKDGKVVAHEGLTSRLPNVVAFAANNEGMGKYMDAVKKRMDRFKADGYYLQHNHPSGDPSPSDQDVQFTDMMQQEVPGMQGHVIINHQQYAVIAQEPEIVGIPIPMEREMRVTKRSMDNKDFRANPEKAHDLLGAKIQSDTDVVQIARAVQAKSGYTTVVYAGAKGGVEAIQEVPDAMVLSKDFTGYIRNSTVNFGATSAYTVSTSDATQPETMDLVRRGVLRDAIIDMDGEIQSARDFVKAPPPIANIHQGRSLKQASKQTRQVMEGEDAYTPSKKFSADAFADLERQDEQINRKEVKAGSQPPSGQPPRGIPPTPAFDGFDVPSESTFERLRRYVQDRFRRLAVTQEAITEQLGPIAEEQDAYLHTELFPGKVEPQIVELERDHFRPLIKAMHEAKVSKDELDQYLYAKHAKERNDHIASINDKMPDGGSGMSNQEAKDILKAVQAKGQTATMDALANRVYAINQKRLDTLVRGGLITAGERQVLNDTYEFYVPLKGAPGEQAPSRPRIGKGFDIRGKENKRALGRKSQAHSILEHVWAQSDEAIIRAEKNLVGQAFLKMAQQYPHKEMWTVNPVKFRKYFDQRTGEVKAGKDPLTKLADNVLSVKVNGKEHYIEIHDEALAQAMKNLGAERSGLILKALQGVNRYLAMVNTALNPEFVLSNFQRDLQTAAVNLTGEQGLKFVSKVMRGVPGAVRGSYGYIAKQDTSTEWGKWFKEYEENGGRIGFFGLEDIEVKRNRLSKLVERLENTPKAKALGLASGLHDLIFDLNGSVENGIRLSTYRYARTELGMSPKKAASLARNLTVDFNKKGIIGNVMNGMYLFFNANLQGTTRLAKALTNKRVQKIVGGAVAGAFMHAELNRWLAGDDPDDGENYFAKLDDYIQESFIPFFYGDPEGKFVKWQLPYGYNTFYWFGQALNRLAHGDVTPGQFLGGFARTLLGAFNPLGSDDMLLKNAVPTFARWWVDLELNKNFFGGPIMPEQFPFQPPKPESELYFRSVSESSKALAQGLNRLTGGSQWRPGWADVSPETIDYMVAYFTGGTGATILRSGSVPAKLIKGLPLESNEIPLVRKFLGNPSSWKASERWRTEADDVATVLRQHKDLKTTDPGAALDFAVESAPLLRLERHMKVAQKALSHLGDLRDAAVSMEDEQEVEALRDASERVQKWFHRAYQQAKDGEVVPGLPYDRKDNSYKAQGKRLALRMRVMSSMPATSNGAKQQHPGQGIEQQAGTQFKENAQEDDPLLSVLGM